jgi:tRNA A-37 threonylcarbamoyl transferase component Bud32
MRPHRTSHIAVSSPYEQDLDYIRDVSEIVYARYTGAGNRWHLVDSDQMWRISFGGRAGVLGVRLNDRTGCVKLYYDERLFNRLRVRLGFSKGRRAYENGLRLQQLAVNCPQMWGYAERRPCGPGMIVTELIDDAVRLDHWIAENGASRDVFGALGRFIGAMHDKGVSHIDLSPRNILVRPRGKDSEFLLLDYEDARFARQVGKRRRLENLHHLHERLFQSVSVRNRLHFLHTYAPENYKAWRNALRRLAHKLR